MKNNKSVSKESLYLLQLISLTISGVIFAFGFLLFIMSSCELNSTAYEIFDALFAVKLFSLFVELPFYFITLLWEIISLILCKEKEKTNVLYFILHIGLIVINLIVLYLLVQDAF